MKSIILFASLLVGTITAAQQSSFFKKGDRVCFVGNSITNNGEFYHNIFLYYVTRFPNQDLSFFNCGISGDVAGGILKRFDNDILVHHPTHVVMMIGMNDVNRGLYGARPTIDPDTLLKREKVLETYKKNVDSIVRLFLQKGIKVILQNPTIYDQTAVLQSTNNFGVNDALKKCATFIEELSQKYHLISVDYWTILQNINTSIQKIDSNATIIGKDRVHPASPGHLIMSYQFLKTTNASKYVSEIFLKANKKKSNKASKNCVIKDFYQSDEQTNFSVRENALPFPTVEAQLQALDLVPFVQDFNLEQLKVEKLEVGNYSLFIDSTSIDTLSDLQLKNGINLAIYPNTPQYKQALEVRSILNDLWKVEADLRTIAYVEFKFLQQFDKREDMAAVKIYLDDLYAKKLAPTGYYKIQFDKYILVKPKELYLITQQKKLRQYAYDAAQTKVHMFTLKRNK